MSVEERMTRNVRTCVPSDTLGTAAQRMRDGDCGCIPVVSEDDARLVGMITDRDICMATHFRARQPGEIAVAEVMSTRVRSVWPSEALADAAAIMADAQVRRLPVVGSGQELVGLISLADLTLEADRERASQEPSFTQREVLDALTAICTRRTPAQLPVSA